MAVAKGNGTPRRKEERHDVTAQSLIIGEDWDGQLGRRKRQAGQSIMARESSSSAKATPRGGPIRRPNCWAPLQALQVISVIPVLRSVPQLSHLLSSQRRPSVYSGSPPSLLARLRAMLFSLPLRRFTGISTRHINPFKSPFPPLTNVNIRTVRLLDWRGTPRYTALGIHAPSRQPSSHVLDGPVRRTHYPRSTRRGSAA